MLHSDIYVYHWHDIDCLIVIRISSSCDNSIFMMRWPLLYARISFIKGRSMAGSGQMPTNVTCVKNKELSIQYVSFCQGFVQKLRNQKITLSPTPWRNKKKAQDWAVSPPHLECDYVIFVRSLSTHDHFNTLYNTQKLPNIWIKVAYPKI